MPAWKGSIAFGLVEVPVVLLPATRRDEIRFSMLDRRDLSPVGYRRYNKTTGEEVDWKDLVRGYEYEKGRFAVLTDADLEKADPKATKAIEILEFVDAKEIDPVLFETPYYVAPQSAKSRGYALLREALERTGRAGIARVVLHTKEHLAALTARGDALVLDLLRFPDEVRDPKEAGAPAGDGGPARPKEPEVEMAVRLVEGMTTAWKPSKHRDTYRQAVLDLVARKVRSGRTTEVGEPEAGRPARRRRRTEVLDLMPLLAESVARRGKSRRTAAAARRRAPAAGRATGPARKGRRAG
jgi:DNA end-binding protein Ku